MTMHEPSFTIGVEEEYLLVDKETRDLASEAPEEIIQECEELAEGQVSPELMRSQIEIGTQVCHDMAEVRSELRRLRSMVVDVADHYGLAPIAASTHPFASWSKQKPTAKERYQSLTNEMQAAARRLVICGMHVHVGIDEDELRIDLMNQMSYFLPHLLSLSCSSPFWRGVKTGLMSYRLTVFDALPRTGLPEDFASFAEYKRHVDILIDAGLMEDASKIWWDLRPSTRFPTLETRIMDVCTYIEDAVSLAALVCCTLRMLYRLRLDNQRWRIYSKMLINENRWRAMRYSFDSGLLDLARGEVVPSTHLTQELIELVCDDAEERGCLDEIMRIREILEQGTSAHKQVAVYQKALDAGADEQEALCKVVDFLIAETQRDIR